MKQHTQNTTSSLLIAKENNCPLFFQPHSSDFVTNDRIDGIQRKCAHCEEEKKTYRKEMNSNETTADHGLESYISNLNNSGQLLPNEVRSFYEPKFGYDFSNVKVHTNPVAAKSAQSINALAYTSGNNIVFNSGQYSPATNAGRKLLAHELTHTIQQKRTDDKNIQRLTFGNDGLLSPDRQKKVLTAAKIAEGVANSPEFAKKWQSFTAGLSKAGVSPIPSIKEYQKALHDRVVHDMDTSTDTKIKELMVDEKTLPLERQTGAVTILNTRRTYMRQFAIDQGIDSIASLLLHESMHGAGIPMGILDAYEPVMHAFEADAGFPMMMGGADILNISEKRIGDYDVDVNINYQLHKIDDADSLKNLEIQVVYPENGNVVFDERAGGVRSLAKAMITGTTGKKKWVWHAKYPGWNTYHVRILNEDRTLRASKEFKTSPKCILGVSSVHCEGD